MSKIQRAVEKARKEGVYEGNSIVQEYNIKPPKENFSKIDTTSVRKEVQVNYKTTKILSVDHKILQQNKIFSISHDSAFTDQIKILRVQILSRLRELGGNSFLVTSANPSEGKTFTSINLGVSIAQEMDRTVLIVDADLRKPFTTHSDFSNDFFGIDVSKGLADYLLEDLDIPDIILNPSIQKLTIIPAGRPLANSAELLNSPRMETLVKELKNRYRNDRIIIFDCPSILVCSDAVVLANYVEGILLVVEAQKTTPNQLRRVKELIKDRPLLGTILNKATE